MTVSLHMAVVLNDPSIDPSYSVLEYEGQISAYDDESNPLGIIGRARAYVAHLDRASQHGFSVLDCLDSRQETTPYLELISLEEDGSFVPSVQRILGEPDTYTVNILIVDRIEILPKHRGHGYGLEAMAAVISHLRHGCRIAAIKPYPLQFEPATSWNTELELDQYTGNKRDSTRRLKNLYTGVGFKSVGRTGLMILDLHLR